jgi:hypothetical protein
MVTEREWKDLCVKLVRLYQGDDPDFSPKENDALEDALEEADML